MARAIALKRLHRSLARREAVRKFDQRGDSMQEPIFTRRLPSLLLALALSACGGGSGTSGLGGTAASTAGSAAAAKADPATSAAGDSTSTAAGEVHFAP
jgi:hypothetical protein